MLKRIVLLLALGAALVGCAGSGTTSTSGTESAAPVESGAASELPSEMPSDSGLEASPSAS